VKNGLGVPQGILLIGGTSDIGRAILDLLVERGTSRVGLVSRDTAAAEAGLVDLIAGHPETDWFHASADLSSPTEAVEAVESLLTEMGDVDVAILAAGELTRDLQTALRPEDVARVISVNMSASVAVLDRLAEAMAAQGGGQVVVLSTVAMERVRPANALYGAAKAGLDAYAQALDHRLAGTGVRVLLVRPGFVASKMTAGLPSAPFATTPAKVAVAVRRGLRRNKRIIWVPGLLRWVFTVFRHLPTVLWRRLPI